MARGKEFTKLNPTAIWRDTDGGSTILLALSMSVVLGSAALAVDYARAVASRQLLASAADVAVLAAVSGLPDVDAAQRIALDYVEKNLPADKFGNALTTNDIEFGSWDSECGVFRPVDDGGLGSVGGDDGTPGGQSSPGCQPSASTFGLAPTAVRLTTRMSQANGNALDTLFAWVFERDSMEISASAVAARGGPPCVLALEQTGSGAVSFAGSATVNTIGCGVQVNSTSLSGLDIKGSASLSSSDICVGGRARYKSGAATPEPTEFCPGISDPMASLKKPEVGPCDHNGATYNKSNATLSPGVYCGGLDIGAHSDITLSPGLYVIQDGPLALASGSSINGSEVTIFLTGNGAVVSFKGQSKIELTAPTTGPTEGVLFFQDPDFGGTHDWKGKSTTFLRGVIYFPSGTLDSKNNNSITPEGSCVVLIAHRLEFSSNSGASIDVTQSNCRESLPGPYSRNIVLLQ